MIYAVTDTHGLIWYLLKSQRLSKSAKDAFDHALANTLSIGVSAITIVEIVYLIEKGKIAADALILLKQELTQNNPLLEIIPLSREIAEALQNISRAQVPDMPDRIITATALHLNVPLISRDGKIKLSQIHTIW